MPDLTPFESRDVASIAIIVRNTGDEAGKGVQRLPLGDDEGDDEGDGYFDPAQHPAPAALSSVRP